MTRLLHRAFQTLEVVLHRLQLPVRIGSGPLPDSTISVGYASVLLNLLDRSLDSFHAVFQGHGSLPVLELLFPLLLLAAILDFIQNLWIDPHLFRSL